MDKKTLITLIDEAADKAYIHNGELFLWLIDIKLALQKGEPIPITEENVALLTSLISRQKPKKATVVEHKPRELTPEELEEQAYMRAEQKKSDETWAKVYESLRDPEYVDFIVKESLEEAMEAKGAKK